MRRAPLLCAFLLACVLAVTQPASASRYVRFGLQDDAWLQYGPGTLEERLAKLDQLGVSLVRFNLHWDQIAPRRPLQPQSPDDPAYAWAGPDAVLDGLHEHGIDVIISLVGAPRWANGGRAPNWVPLQGSTFAAFASAAAKRYPWVKRWVIWNEPNQRRWLRPTSPALYVVRLLNPAYVAIHEALPGALVAGGATAPRGATGGVSPVAWILGMSKAGAHLDAYAHHPYPLSPHETPFTGGCTTCETLTMATLDRLVRLVDRAFGPKRIWLTEYGYQTNPPDRTLGVSPALQALYVGEAALRAFEEPRVDVLIHYLYRDEPDLARFQSGLVRLDGKPKPALDAFRLPFAEISHRGLSTVLWAQVRARAGPQPYRLQILRNGEWAWLGAAGETDGRGFIRRTVRAASGDEIRIWSPSDDVYSMALRVS
jgi:hypothetical protein